MKKAILKLSCPAIGDTERAFDTLFNKFLQPLDEFVRRNKVGRIMVMVRDKDRELESASTTTADYSLGARLMVSLFSGVTNKPFLVNYPVHCGLLEFRFYQNLTVIVRVAGDETESEFRMKHQYLPADSFSKQLGGGAQVNWREACQLIIHFFQTIADQMVVPDRQLLDDFGQFSANLEASHVGVDI